MIGQNGSSPEFSDWLDRSLCKVCESKVNIIVKFENKRGTMELVQTDLRKRQHNENNFNLRLIIFFNIPRR